MSIENTLHLSNIGPGADRADDPMFARSMVRDGLRQDIDQEVLTILDAVSIARDIKRCELVSEILGDYARQRQREATLIGRLTRGNPQTADGVAKERAPA